MKPRLLDLFCGAGGAAMGYARAGFEVVGVDNRPQPNYPFEFIHADALDVIHHDHPLYRSDGRVAFDAIHASPPCQRYSTATKRNGTQHQHPDLIGPTRELLEQTGLPYVIENVVSAPLEGHVLCGTTFGLETDGYRLRRHRLFETSWPMLWPACQCHQRRHVPVMDVTGGGPTKEPRTDGGGGRPYKGTADQARRIMGIDWMTKAELNEAIPPAYTSFIGERLLPWLHASGRLPADSSHARIPDTSASPDRRTDSRPNKGVPGGSAFSAHSSQQASVQSASSSLPSGQDQDARG